MFFFLTYFTLYNRLQFHSPHLKVFYLMGFMPYFCPSSSYNCKNVCLICALTNSFSPSLIFCMKYNTVFPVQFSSVTQSCATLCDPMNRSTLGLPVHHQLLDFTQTHNHRVSDAIQPSHPLSSPSPSPNPSQHQSFPKSQLFA